MTSVLASTGLVRHAARAVLTSSATGCSRGVTRRASRRSGTTRRQAKTNAALAAARAARSSPGTASGSVATSTQPTTIMQASAVPGRARWSSPNGSACLSCHNEGARHVAPDLGREEVRREHPDEIGTHRLPRVEATPAAWRKMCQRSAPTRKDAKTTITAAAKRPQLPPAAGPGWRRSRSALRRVRAGRH